MNGAPSRRAVLRMLEAALPFEHRPAVVVVGRELREDGRRNRPGRRRASGSGRRGSTQDWIAGIDALPAGRIELRVLDVKRLDPLVVDVDEGRDSRAAAARSATGS